MAVKRREGLVRKDRKKYGMRTDKELKREHQKALKKALKREALKGKKSHGD